MYLEMHFNNKYHIFHFHHRFIHTYMYVRISIKTEQLEFKEPKCLLYLLAPVRKVLHLVDSHQPVFRRVRLF